MTQNTVLITGGSSGIGLELAGRLLKRKKKVIICGRSSEKLKRAREMYSALHVIQCDLSDPDDRIQLTDRITKEHPDCNILVNNAAVVHRDSFLNGSKIMEKARAEVETNLIAPIALTKGLLPLLMTHQHGRVINITSGLVYAPRAIYPFYNATKAALHSFTMVLREQLKETNVEVIEVMFPAVDTPWHQGSPPKIAISTKQAVDEMMKGLAKGKNEIHVGGAAILRLLSRVAPGFAFKKINALK
ncbi:SDR family NAD(P)-dependent oxidoreductase [Balneolaceae bacterium ANBcel3]|nr:SDR family NAD(P)-dependent oxidoreductase [Balneolaceae bacterium ANBcel3]